MKEMRKSFHETMIDSMLDTSVRMDEEDPFGPSRSYSRTVARSLASPGDLDQTTHDGDHQHHAEYKAAVDKRGRFYSLVHHRPLSHSFYNRPNNSLNETSRSEAVNR